jgi:hypothetical protein
MSGILNSFDYEKSDINIDSSSLRWVMDFLEISTEIYIYILSYTKYYFFRN